MVKRNGGSKEERKWEGRGRTNGRMGNTRKMAGARERERKLEWANVLKGEKGRDGENVRK